MKFLCVLLVLVPIVCADTFYCEVPCTREYKPVCGTDGEHFKIFNNPCLLRNEHCKDGRNWFQTRMNECNNNVNVRYEEKQNCEVPCTRELRPVCGTDGEHFKVFSNPCVLGNQHCKDGHNWFQTRMEKCGNNDKEDFMDKCMVMCPAIFAPVCGFDGDVYKLFPSKCVMEVENCRNHKTFKASTLEKCPTL